MTRLFHYIQMANAKAREGHLPLSRQIFEMVLLYLYRGLGPGYYLFGRFWRREIPLRDKLRHLNERDYARQIAKVNNPLYQKLSQHKVAEKAILSLFNIPTPRFYGYLHVSKGQTYCGEPLRGAMDLTILLEKERPKRICFKLVEGWSGKGFEAAEVRFGSGAPTLRPLPDGAPLDVETYVNVRLEILSYAGGRVVEEYCVQHPWYQSLNPTSVNTLRVFVLLNARQPARILGGYLRTGRKGSITDNTSNGGIYFPFDPKTGILQAGRYKTISTEYFLEHPDSGIRVEGQELPGWREVCDLMPRALEAFPNILFAGLDVAMTEDGPTIIELNAQPDRNVCCNLDIPTLDILTP
jgi:hypothetical protein